MGIAPPPSGPGRRVAAWQVVAVGVMAAALFWGTAGVSLMDQDEARFAEAARVMYQTGDYVSPRFNDQPRFAKPVLIYWLMAGSYALFGVSEFAARLPSAVSTILTAVLLWRFCRVIGRPHLGLLAAAIWLAWLQTTLWGRAAVTDPTLTLFLTAALMLIFLGLRADGSRRDAAFAGAGAMMGLAFLTKGVMGLALPALITFGYLVSVGRLRAELGRIRWWQPALLFLVVAFPWYYLEYRAAGVAFLKSFFIFEHLERFAGGAVHRSVSPFSYLYFVGMLAIFAFPFSGVAPAAMARAWRQPFHLARPAGHRLGRFLFLWLAVVLVGFSLSKTKNPQYIQLCYPALALLAGNYFDRLWRRRVRLERGEKLSLGLGLGVGALLALVFALLPLLLKAHTTRYGAPVDQGFYPISWALSSVVGLGSAAMALTWLSGRRDRAFGLMVAVPWAFGLLLVWPTWPMIIGYSQDPIRHLATLARNYVPEGRSLLCVHLTPSSAVYYSRRHVDFTWSMAYERLVAREGHLRIMSPTELRTAEWDVARGSLRSGRAAAVLTRVDALSELQGLGPWTVAGRDGPYLLLLPGWPGHPPPRPRTMLRSHEGLAR